MKYFRYLLFCLLLTSCYNVERDCKKFHTGIFEFEVLVGDKILSSTFVRSENFEIETFEGVTDSAKIRWVNDCECVLTKLNPVSNQDKRPLVIKILTTNKNQYTFEYRIVGDLENIKRGTITKISD